MKGSTTHVRTNTSRPRIALTTYSVKPRGGVVHTLELAEALQKKGVDVTVVAMGDPSAGFFRDVTVPVRIIQAPAWHENLESRVFSWIDAMEAGFNQMLEDFDIVHSQDCISARAAARVRDSGANFKLFRTVHHVDDFKTQALMDCQRNAILEPDRVLVVSELWQKRLAEEYATQATVVTNGVRTDRFTVRVSAERRAELRQQLGVTDRFVYLTVGGIEPRKGSRILIDALALLKADRDDVPALAIIGGHSFQDYNDYRDDVLHSLPALGLELDNDVILLGTVSEQEFPEWFAAVDGFVFPSVNEGWGLVILEAASAGLPVVASDIDVFREFLVDGEDAILTKVANPQSLAAGMARLLDEPQTARRLSTHGPVLADRYPWSKTADQHITLYDSFLSTLRATRAIHN